MLNTKELKVVVSTLAKRRAWLRKNLEDSSIGPEIRKENVEALQLLDSATQKLASLSPPNKSQTAPMTVKTPVPLEAARILIAEDNADSAELLLGILEDMGIKHVDCANDGRDAFEKIKKAHEPYDIILCDWDMPELSGIEVHNKAKASNTLRDTHFIMVTAMSEKSNIKQAVQQGINDYIIKPLDVDILENKVKAALRLC